MSGKYRCFFCKHREVELDVFTALGDQHVGEHWACRCRDDETCIPGCGDFEPKEGKSELRS